MCLPKVCNAHGFSPAQYRKSLPQIPQARTLTKTWFSSVSVGLGMSVSCSVFGFVKTIAFMVLSVSGKALFGPINGCGSTTAHLDVVEVIHVIEGTDADTPLAEGLVDGFHVGRLHVVKVDLDRSLA